jgi:hypothetical protein
VGAAAAAIVVVTVYEGKVLTATPRGGGGVELEAGEAARLEPGRSPRILAEAAADTNATGSTAAPGRRSYAARTADALVKQNAKLSREKQRLEQELEVLRSRLDQRSGAKSQSQILDLDKKDLLAMARRCELRWDMPPLSGTNGVDSRAVKDLGLTEGEQAAIKKVLKAHHARMKSALRKLYVEVTGDSKGVDLLSLHAITSEIEDKSPRGETKRVFQRLARERAGLQAPPRELSRTSAAERLYRLLTGAGDRVERAMGAQIGPDLARRVRRVRGGFGSRYRSSHGCPKPR